MSITAKALEVVSITDLYTLTNVFCKAWFITTIKNMYRNSGGTGLQNRVNMQLKYIE